MANAPQHGAKIPVMYPFDPTSSRHAWIPGAYDFTLWPRYPAAPVGSHLYSATLCYLYRFYDEDRRPLYFGVTTNLVRRWATHRSYFDFDWWPVARFVSVEPVSPSRRLLLEHLAIEAERPRFNRMRPYGRTTSQGARA